MIRSAISVRGSKGVTGTLATNAGDVRLRAVVGNVSFSSDSTFDVDALSLSLEKPGFFIVDYDVADQDVRFQFMNTVNVLEKRLSWTYNHCRNGNRTILDGSLALDSANKVSGTYELGSANRKIKYSYVHGGVTTLEPSYDFGRNSWDLALSHRFDNDVIRASYDAASKNLGVEWSCKSSLNSEGRVKISASFNLAEGLGIPKLTAESTWNFEM